MVKKQRISYIAPREGSWIIPNVNYRGKTGIYRIFEKMTPAMTQDKLSELYEEEKQKRNPYPMDSILHFAIFNQAYNLRNSSDTNQLRNFLQTGIRKYPHTLSRVNYNPFKKDKIIHNYKTSDEYSIDAEVVGPDNWFAEIPDKDILKSFLGTNNVDKINKVFQWINNTKGYLWRVNSKPSEKDERVVRFGAYGRRLDLGCDRDPRYECPAFRVLQVE